MMKAIKYSGMNGNVLPIEMHQVVNANGNKTRFMLKEDVGQFIIQMPIVYVHAALGIAAESPEAG